MKDLNKYTEDELWKFYGVLIANANQVKAEIKIRLTTTRNKKGEENNKEAYNYLNR